MALLVFPAVMLFAAFGIVVADWLNSLDFLEMVAVLVGFYVVFALVGVVAALYLRRLPRRAPAEWPVRTIELVDGCILQSESGEIHARIDATSSYEYEVLDRYDAGKAVFRLHQLGRELTFRFSDPGAPRIVRDVMGLTWPPPARHAGRSYAPPAV